jgi:ABC-type dipeptide/oligopeptide/nickel transport system permease component
MPALLLGLVQAGIIARITRSSMVEVMGQDYIVTARSKGLRERAVIFGHALKNALIPAVTIGGLQLGALLNGAVIIEAVFARPGIGSLAIHAITQKDFPLVQGIVLFSATVYVLINILVDISYAFLDPRIRYR